MQLNVLFPVLFSLGKLKKKDIHVILKKSFFSFKFRMGRSKTAQHKNTATSKKYYSMKVLKAQLLFTYWVKIDDYFINKTISLLATYVQR